MGNTWLIARRELNALFRSPIGYVAAAAALLGVGIWFIAQALAGLGNKRLSAQVLAVFFEGVSGAVMILGIALSMRLIAHEQEHGTLVLMKTAPLSDRELVIGKFLAVFVVLLIIIGLTGYMPWLIYKSGKVSVGHIMVGYLGSALLGAATVSIGLFASALAKNQVVAAIVGAAIMVTMVLMWMIGKVVDPPINDFINGLAVHHLRQRDFMTGVLRLENVMYYVAVSFCFLLGAVKTLEARRWR